MSMTKRGNILVIVWLQTKVSLPCCSLAVQADVNFLQKHPV